VKRSSQLSALATLFVGILAADQTSKHFARGLLRAIDLGPLLVTYTENRGAFLSFGENLPDHVRAWLLKRVVRGGHKALAI
jgi:hypothetical protein